MCGIYGILGLKAGASPSTTELARMAMVSVHRGPDDEGVYADTDVLLGMRRLSIIDVGGGHQPIANEDGTVHVVCNGEIYNYRELTESLLRAGHRFKTRSDSEVLVHLYEDHGQELVHQLNGMFAFALWDTRRRRLLIGRDRLGIKPLYYRQENGRLLFASEAKSILSVVNGPREIDPAALHEYLALGYVPAPLSMFRSIRKLPPGSLLISEAGEVRISRYWLPTAEVDERFDERAWIEAFLGTMDRAVASQMVSDVPLGAFLSGGIDSSTIVGLMARHSAKPIKTYSIGFADASGADYYNELPWALRVAEHFHTDHREILVRPDVARLLPRLLWHMDEPIADAAFITTFLVAELAREDVTVILSGVGGDELFGGYRRYLGSYYDRYYERLPGWLRRGLLLPLAHALPSDRHSALLNLSRHLRTYLLSAEQPFDERYRAYVRVFARSTVESLLREPTPSMVDTLGDAFRAVGNGDALSRVARVDLLTQLPDDLLQLTDKMTMATSLECRVPFLDNAIIDLSLRMPSRFKIHGRELKHLLKRALVGLLPPEILQREKRGFGAPMGAWLKGELAPLVRTVLSRDAVDRRGLLHWKPIERAIALHFSNREDHTDHLIALMNLELWCRIYLDNRSPEEVAGELTESAG